MKNTVCIIQARRQSERLPDKILLPLGNKLALEHVIGRCIAIKGVNTVIVACPDEPHEDKVEEVAKTAGALSFRGSMHDVLARYWGAANMTDCDYVIRVTADCPFLDPIVCGTLLENTITANADYGGLHHFPHGLDCEVFTKTLLDETYSNATNPLDREHVTLWMKRRADLKKVFHQPDEGYFHQKNRWVLDYPEDYDFLKAVFNLISKDKKLSGIKTPNWRQILDLIEQNPQVREINQQQIADWAEKTQVIVKEATTS
jgi:spore coat polysaccharide biosynthesis protein SpsF (cytidylyltransferase family)